MEASEGVTQTTPEQQSPPTEAPPAPPPAPSTEQPPPAEPQQQVPPPGEGTMGATAQEPAPPPDIGDAIQQMNQNIADLRKDVVGEQPRGGDGDFIDSLFGDPDPEPEGTTYQPAPQQQPQYGQPQPADPEQQQQQQAERQLESYIQNRIEQAMEPHLASLQLQQDRRDALALKAEFPRLGEPEVARAVAGRMDEIASRYDNEAMRTDPLLARQQYLAWEAEQANAPQSSPGAEVPGQAPAAAGGNQGVAPMETGAGPGVPPEQVDAQTQAYMDALAGTPQENRDIIG